MTTLTTTAARSDINVTPLIDVLLVLLIIFMVITPLMPHGLRASVPRPSSDIQPANDTAIVLELTGDNKLRLNTREITASDLPGSLAQIFSARANKVIFIKADAKLEYRDVARILDLIGVVDPSIQFGLITSRGGLS